MREIRYIEAPSFGPRPQVAMCSSCGSQVTTSTSKSLSLAAWTIILHILEICNATVHLSGALQLRNVIIKNVLRLPVVQDLFAVIEKLLLD